MAARRFLCVATEWDSGCGGLSTFNRELCIALARLEQEVTCYVPQADAGTVSRAKAANVELVGASQSPGLGWRELLLLRPPNTDGIDIVIGHGRITGGSALALRNTWFREARYVHFIHMDPKAIEWHKHSREEEEEESEDTAEKVRERLDTELALAQTASLVVAVGPRLYKWFDSYLSSDRKRVHSFIPGLLPSEHRHRPLAATSCLLLGRADEVSLKGIDLAAEALEFARATDGAFSRDVRFTVRGVLPKASKKLVKRLRTVAPSLALDPEPFTSDRDEVLRSIRRAALVLMPSREEGFGLAGLEAISEGVPVLISRASGLAEAMTACARELAAPHIIDVSAPPQDFGKRICDVIEDQGSACARLLALRDAMRPIFSWDRSTREFLDALDASSPPTPATGSADASANGSPAADPTGGFHDTVGNLGARLLAASQALLQWPQRLPGGEWLERDDENVLYERLLTPGNPIALLGPPGSGKSALLARLGDRLKGEGRTLLAIKADLLPREVSDERSLASAIGLDSESITAPVEALAQAHHVVVLLDQLDALSSTIDVETARLSVLLEVVSRLSTVANVQVVLSCRSFDFAHDARFRRAEVDRFDLSPLSRDDVVDVLTKAGVPASSVSEKLVTLLQLPHWLNLLLQLHARAPQVTSSETRHALLEEFWQQRVLAGSTQLERAALEIASSMAQREELWVPRGEFPGFTTQISALEQRDVLRTERSGLRLAFAHQTLFEFALAKALPASDGALTSLVRQRAGSLRVRPLVASALAYLRDVNAERYHAELEALWSSTDLRRHLRELILTFLGQQTPSLREQALVLDAISGPLRLTALAAIAGRPAWFDALHQSQLPAWMSASSNTDVVPLLHGALPFARSRVLELVREHWASDEAKEQTVGWLLCSAPEWDDETVLLAARLIEEGNLPEHLRTSLIAAARKTDAGRAAVLLGVELRRRLGALRSALPPETEIPPDASEGDRIRLYINREPRRSFESLLDEVNQLYGLSEIAKGDPGAFLREVWPWFTDVVTMITDKDDATGDRLYASDHSLATDPHDRGPGTGVPEALGLALRDLSLVAPSAFEEFVLREADRSQMAVHRLLTNALAEAAPTNVDLAIGYLLADPRRLNIGAIDVDDDTCRLLRSLAPHLSPERLRVLEDAIQESVWADEKSAERDARARRAAMQLNRDHRIRLFSALGADRLSPKTLVTFEQEVRARPHAVERRAEIRLRAIESPVSLEQMRRMGDEDLFAFFATLPDETDFEHPRRSLVGGSVQASRILEEMTKLETARCAALLPHFPSTNQRPAAHVISGLGKSDYPLSELERRIIEVDRRGFHSAEVRWHAAHTLEGRFSAKEEMSAEMEALLKTWLSDALDEESGTTERPQVHGAILWGLTGGGVLPSGNYPTLAALTAGLLRRAEPRFDAWVDVLERHLARREHKAVWRALSRWLRFVVNAGAERGERFLAQLFERQPELLTRSEGVQLVAHASSWVTSSSLESWMGSIRAGGGPFGEQAYGELLGLMVTRANPPEWAGSAVEEISATENRAQLGLTFAAANLWDEPTCRSNATELLLRVIAVAESPEHCDAVMRCFDTARALPSDGWTATVLKALASRPAVLRGESVRFVEHLRKLLPFEAATISQVARAYVDQIDDAHAGRLMYGGEELADVAVTLQRLSPQLRDEGLTLFEKLLERRSQASYALLREIDDLPSK